MVLPEEPTIASCPSPHLCRFRTIGVILSGGGAKGVYQAGALTAVHEYLASHGLLGRINCIAATSIGSWNALFWLAKLIPSGALENWWTTFQPAWVVRPAVAIPIVQPYLLSYDPWRDEFGRLFGEGSPAGQELLQLLNPAANPKIYFTRTDVRRARLAFGTNDETACKHVSDENGHDYAPAELLRKVSDMREAVLTSMAIPPVFDYSFGASAGEYEDGGVADNLPLRFASYFTTCELLIVLPLNATFDAGRRPRTLPGRMLRALDVRQAMLERQSLKFSYWLNVRRVLSKRDPIPVFAICPGQPLHINTWDLGRSRELRSDVFEQMRSATWQALAEFFAKPRLDAFFRAWESKREDMKTRLHPEGWVRMAVVPPGWRPDDPLHCTDAF